MTGYAFAKLKVRGASLIFMIILSGLTIPSPVSASCSRKG
jgi:ABC-type glycerol-3-phosphate transport system permease component